MLALLSRTNQALSFCRCRTCLHSTSTITRRSTTSASRRKVTAADIFTACYTTILGTATVIDHHRKRARKEDLDQKLEKARADLQSLKDGSRSPSCDDYTPSAASRPDDDTRSDDAHPEDGGGKVKAGRDTLAMLEEVRQAAARVYTRQSRSSWLQTQIDWVAAEAAILSEEGNPKIYIRHPKSDKQLEMTVRSTEALVGQLLKRAHGRRDPNAPALEPDNDPEGESLLQEVEELERQYPRYRSPLTDPDAETAARAFLSETFRRIFNRTTSIKQTVGKICYNLLLSDFPPNVHNYNVLIAGFNRAQRPDLALAVIDSFLDQVKWPATQQTIICLLNHARSTSNLALFREVVGRMRGVTEDGLHYFIISRDAVWSTDDAFARFIDLKCTIRKTKFVRRAKRGNVVFDQLIRGWLHFGQVGTACMAFIACLRNAHIISVGTIRQLLADCLGTMNQTAARVLLKGFEKNFMQFEYMVEYTLGMSTPQTARLVADMVSALITLCEAPYMPWIGAVNQTLWETVRKLESRHFVTHTKSDLQDSVDTSDDVVNQLVHGSPIYARLNRILHALEAGRSQRLHDARLNSTYIRLAKVATLVRRYQRIEEKTQRIDAHVKAAVLRREFGCDVEPYCPLPSVDWAKFRGWGEKLPEIVHILHSLQLGPRGLTEDGVKSHLLENLPDEVLARRFKKFAKRQNLSLEVLISFYADGQPHFKWQVSKLRIHEQVGKREDITRILLFTHLDAKTQIGLRWEYPHWRTMPLSVLVERHEARLYEYALAIGKVPLDHRDLDVPPAVAAEDTAGTMTPEAWGQYQGLVAFSEPQQLGVTEPAMSTAVS